MVYKIFLYLWKKKVEFSNDGVDKNKRKNAIINFGKLVEDNYIEKNN